ncbi:MAG: SRPBCC family protein [Anderseniella sp.]|jgi:uncharacterized membrane protein|nr:SRPBCC family protein [Anderseniella sp.]
MKKPLIWSAISLVGVALVMLLVGISMPRVIEVSRSVLINAPADEVYPHAADLRAFHKWSPWSGIDPGMTVEFSGPDAGAGQKMSWTSPGDEDSSGSKEIVAVEENRLVVSELDLGGMGTATARLDLEPEGDATRVTWSLETDLGNNPLARMYGRTMEINVASQFDTGLARLKRTVEER